jgi:hypothetical protein
MDDKNEMPEFALEELDDVAGGCGRRGGDRNFFSCQCPPQQNNDNDMLMMMMMMQMFQDPRGRRRR